MNAIDRVKASKRKAKAQRDNWKQRALAFKCMVCIFRGCIETGIIPAIGSPCHKKVLELLEEKEAGK